MVFLEYFNSIFASSNPTLSQQVNILNGIQPIVTPVMNARLLAPFCRAEIERAINQMFPTKVPGPDGFPVLFYQKYWDVVGNQTVAGCLDVLNNRKSIRGWNKTHIALIPRLVLLLGWVTIDLSVYVMCLTR